MASGHVNRTKRPNTWLHRPACGREESPCQPGAVHTWHFSDLPAVPTNVRSLPKSSIARTRRNHKTFDGERRCRFTPSPCLASPLPRSRWSAEAADDELRHAVRARGPSGWPTRTRAHVRARIPEFRHTASAVPERTLTWAFASMHGQVCTQHGTARLNRSSRFDRNDTG
jgi:hypothetical protein